MDGSILPYGTDRPQKDSKLYESYTELTESFKKLYETCRKNNTYLAGVVEDSSGLRLTSLLKDKVVPGIIKSNEFDQQTTLNLDLTKDILDRTNDSNIMYYILGVGERSCVFSYTRAPEKHQILKDLGTFGKDINSFYMKSVQFDRPVRIDFLDDGKTENLAEEIASIVLALSMHNETYGCPTILIEADARAKLSERDLDLIYQRLRDKTGDVPSLFQLRRELRPF